MEAYSVAKKTMDDKIVFFSLFFQETEYFRRHHESDWKDVSPSSHSHDSFTPAAPPLHLSSNTLNTASS